VRVRRERPDMGGVWFGARRHILSETSGTQNKRQEREHLHVFLFYSHAGIIIQNPPLAATNMANSSLESTICTGLGPRLA